MTVVTKLEIESTEYPDKKNMIVNKSMGDFNTAGDFIIEFDNDTGQFSNTFNLNDTVSIYSDMDAASATTKIFTGIIEDIKFEGKSNKEIVILTGRDFSAILQDIVVEPRIFKDAEVSAIVKSIMSQNVPTSLVTANNVDATSTTLDKITFNGPNVYDALRRLSELSGFFFFVDEDKDLHFEEKNAIASGETFDNTNVTKSNFRESDHEIYNTITVIGERQKTGATEIETVVSNGSKFILDAKPFEPRIIISGAENTVLQPGGIINVNDPRTENVKYLVDFQGRNIILTSGTTAGDNTLPTGSVVIINYNRSTPLIITRIDSTSVDTYGPKEKKIVDKNIKDVNEANDVGTTFLNEHKDPKIQGKMDINGILNVTPGNTAVINLPFQNQSNQTYAILNAKYNFNTINNLSNNVLKVAVNKKISDFIDHMKTEILRLRSLENAEVDTSVTSLELTTGSIGVSGTSILISTSIGSVFMFGTPGHNQLNSSTALLGFIQGGSTVFQDGIQI